MDFVTFPLTDRKLPSSFEEILNTQMVSNSQKLLLFQKQRSLSVNSVKRDDASENELGLSLCGSVIC